ncbi:wax ester/triacylglycerol synthase domain-containing protein [Sanguibacter suarezii]|uniref:wax ester/triacylglycerol synthase domain-containing protein n=1 Tax=Sanguibacter suarezii TaxID=60921 RepID=UPI001FE08CA7|nr:wax ester/triacylglycerol synthase domain-containing protein [Sanguibacter suarezii]
MRESTGRLASVDEASLVIDHAGQVNVFLIAGLLAAGGFVDRDGAADLAALRAGLCARIAVIPALRRIPAPVGRRHRWVDASPDLSHHIRLVDPVDGLGGLERMCGELMTVPLPLDRPPWELLVVPGAGASQVGFVLRIHHVIADGVAALAIVEQLFEPDPQGQPQHLRSHPSPAATSPAPGPLGSSALSALRRAGVGVRRVLTMVGGRGTGPTVLLGSCGPNRGVVFVDADLTALRARARPLPATVNDALLAAAAAGYRSAMAAGGDHVPADLPVSVPVALRRRGTSSNQIGVMRVLLPLAVTDSDARLRLVAARTREEKALAREQGTLEFMRGPWGARIMDRVARRQHVVAGFITNLAGPAELRCLAGAPAVAIWPVAGLAGNVRLGVAAVSYAGRLRCSVHFDAAAVPGEVFAHAMKEELTRAPG